MTFDEYRALSREEQVRLGAEAMAISVAVEGENLVRSVQRVRRAGAAKTTSSGKSTSEVIDRPRNSGLWAKHTTKRSKATGRGRARNLPTPAVKNS